MFGILTEVKKDETKLMDWREDKPLLEAQENSRKLKEKRGGLEQQLLKAINDEAEKFASLDAAIIEHMISKISDKELAGFKEKHKAARANTVQIQGLIQEHDLTFNRLQKGIDILTREAKEKASKNIIEVYKKAIAELAQKLEEAALINKEAARLHNLSLTYGFDEGKKYFNIPGIGRLPLLYWKEFNEDGYNPSRLSLWQKDVKKYGFID